MSWTARTRHPAAAGVAEHGIARARRAGANSSPEFPEDRARRLPEGAEALLARPCPAPARRPRPRSTAPWLRPTSSLTRRPAAVEELHRQPVAAGRERVAAPALQEALRAGEERPRLLLGQELGQALLQLGERRARERVALQAPLPSSRTCRGPAAPRRGCAACAGRSAAAPRSRSRGSRGGRGRRSPWPRARPRRASGRNPRRPRGSCAPCRPSTGAPAPGGRRRAPTSRRGRPSGVWPWLSWARRSTSAHRAVRMPPQRALGIQAPRLGGRRDLKEHPAQRLVVQSAAELCARRRRVDAGSAGSSFFSICFQTASANMSAGSRGGRSLKSAGCAAPCAFFSPALICSHWVSTCSEVSSLPSPKTCGWRRTSFSFTSRATSSRSKCPASSASWAWKITWIRTSPSSSRMCGRSSRSIVSRSSLHSSIRQRARLWWVCSWSQGQPPGPLSRAMVLRSSSMALMRSRMGPFGGP